MNGNTCLAAVTVTVTGATTSMVAVASPLTNPGVNFVWKAHVSSANTVSIYLCNLVNATATPAASVYNVRVIQ